jgi:hypothetical protein
VINTITRPRSVSPNTSTARNNARISFADELAGTPPARHASPQYRTSSRAPGSVHENPTPLSPASDATMTASSVTSLSVNIRLHASPGPSASHHRCSCADHHRMSRLSRR